MLFDQGTDPEILRNRNSFAYSDSRYMPVGVKTPAWILIYKNVTVIFVQQKHLAIELINEEVAQTFKAYFDAYWKDSKPFEEKTGTKRKH